MKSSNKGTGLSQAWSGPGRSRPNKPASPGKSGDGLKQAWSNQTAKPSKLTDMSAAKKKVR